MTINEQGVAHKEASSIGEIQALQQRIFLLEQALAQYIERYGLTDKAREVLQASRLKVTD